jgi:hypothetical protein
MKTDDLVNILSTNLDPVDWRSVSRRLLGAAAVGAFAALAGMMLSFGPRTDISDFRAWSFLAVKLAFAGVLVAISLACLVRVARPGGEQRASLALVILPFAAALVVLVVALVLAPPSAWQAMIFGQHWLLCIGCIPLNAIFPFAAIIFAMRRFASPTNLARAGALVGLAAGGISAVVYALHCPDDSLAFITLWYGLTIALCTVVGALLGPRLLRW